MSWIDVNGVCLRYRVEGRSGAPVIVLIHEIGGSLESFDAAIAPLVSDFRILSFDQRGSGLSEKVRSSFGIDELTGDLAELIDRTCSAGTACNFVTVAAGGLQALRLFEVRRDLVGSITLCNPALGVDTSRASFLLERADFAETHGMRAGIESTLDKSYQPELRDDVVFPDVRGRYLANDPYGFAESNRVLARTDMRGKLSSLDCPVMVVAGRHDQVRPHNLSEELAKQIPKCRFELIDGGHFLPSMAGVVLGELISDFVSSL